MLIVARYLMNDRITQERGAKVAHAVLLSVDLELLKTGMYGDFHFSAREISQLRLC